jgi:hypothetical protein
MSLGHGVDVLLAEIPVVYCRCLNDAVSEICRLMSHGIKAKGPE